MTANEMRTVIHGFMNINTASATLTIPPHPSGRRPLLTPLPEPGHFLLVLDNSSAEKFVTCPQSAYNYLVLGREAHAKNAALTFGGALHAGIEKLLVGVPLADAQSAVENFFTDHPAPLDDYRTVENAKQVLQHYELQSRMPDYDWTILSDEQGPIVERAFELPLGVLEVGADIAMPWLDDSHVISWHEHANGPRTTYVSHIHVAWSGRIDAVAHAHGMTRVVDHKTTSIAGDQVIQDFHLSNQTIGYVWAAKQLWPEHNPQGFCVNFIHFKRPSSGQKGLTEKGPRGGEPPLNFFRSYFQYSDERLAWWANNALTIVSDFVHNLVRNHFPSHTKWCFGKYGQCPYHPVCSEDSAELRAKLIQSDLYRPVTWNPVRA